MRTIQKYDIEPGINILWLPLGATVLKVACHPRSKDVGLWALVDPEMKMNEERAFVIAPTGALVPDEIEDPAHFKYLETFIVGCGCPDGDPSHDLVFHVFEQLKFGPEAKRLMNMGHLGVC